MTREQVFLSQLATIERVIRWVCARRCLRGADADDFGATVKLRLIENDYAILGRFEGRSSLKTYLTVVINRLYLDYQTQRFGRWRPSAEARRLGTVALHLETLLYRDGLSFDEACGVLPTGRGMAASREVLETLRQRLPDRVERPADALVTLSDAEPPAHGNGHAELERVERKALAHKACQALSRALERLSPRDRLLLRLHFEAGLTLAEVARSMGEEQKPLYRKRDALLKQLRAELEAEGIRDADAQELLSTSDWLEDAGPGPSLLEGRTDLGEAEP